MRPFSFPNKHSARAFIAAERALSLREQRHSNVIVDGGFECLRDTQAPIIDTVARSALQSRRLEDAARLGGGLGRRA